MPLSNCADRMPVGNGPVSLQLEILEGRRLLSTSKVDVILAPASPSETQPVPDLIRAPAISLNDHIGPVVDCPGLDPRFCLPREIKPRNPSLADSQQVRYTKQTDYVFRALIWRTLERIDVDPISGSAGTQ